LKIVTVLPTYPENPDVARCLRYVELAEGETLKYEPDWVLEHHVLLGNRVGDGVQYSHERMLEIARMREAALRYGAEHGEWTLLLDTDVMVPPELYRVMFHMRPDLECKSAQTWNAETGVFRFVDDRYEAQWSVDNSKGRYVERAS